MPSLPCIAGKDKNKKQHNVSIVNRRLMNNLIFYYLMRTNYILINSNNK